MKSITNKYNRWLILIIFLSISIILHLNHEPWRDEAEAWLIARDAPNLESIFERLESIFEWYERTPMLWYLILFPLTKLELPYYSISILHFIINLYIIIVFLNFAPFDTFKKTLFIFGYFIIYEYNVIARNYALSVLLIFIIAVIYKKRFKHPWIYISFVALLSNTNSHSLFISLGLIFIYLYEYLNKVNNKKITFKFIFILITSLVILLIPIIQILPPSDLQSLPKAKLDLTFERIGSIPNSVLSAFFPIPQIKPDFWGTKMLYYPSIYLAILGVPLFILSLLPLIKKKYPLAIYVITSLGLFAIFFLISPGATRHHGFIFIMWIFSLWISKYYPKNDSPFMKLKFVEKFNVRKYTTYFMIFILLIHVIAALIAAFYELNYNFSNSKDVAMFIKQNNFNKDNTLIATYSSSPATSILPYIEKDYKFYCLEFGGECIFTKWYKLPRNRTLTSIKKRIRQFENTAKEKKHIIILTEPEYITKLNLSDRYKLIKSFEKSISREDYFIYEQINK